MIIDKTHYDFGLPIFKKNPFYIRLAQEHLSILNFQDESIKWEVISTRSSAKIPNEYRIHYTFSSIIGVNEDQSPIFGNHHTARITFPPNYPTEQPVLYMETDIWHPNVKSEGRFKGRICGNTKGFATDTDLVFLIIRLADILKYNNYHAEHTPPYPEDMKVATWVKDYGEPYAVVSKKRGLNMNFIPPVPEEIEKEEMDSLDAESLEEDSDMPPRKERRKIKIKSKREKEPPKPNRFKIKERK